MVTVAARTNVVNWFEIPVRDLDRARKFYETVFDVTLTPEEMGGMKMAMFPFEMDARGASGALMRTEPHQPTHAGTLVYFSVEDIPETLRRINANGGKTLMPKASIGKYGSIAQYEDTEGNRMALHSMK